MICGYDDNDDVYRFIICISKLFKNTQILFSIGYKIKQFKFLCLHKIVRKNISTHALTSKPFSELSKTLKMPFTMKFLESSKINTAC